jgi:agmatinase
MFHTSNTFVGFNHKVKEADVVFLGIPFGSTSTSKPAIYGPVMVRESLKLTEDFIDGKNVFEKLKISDIGDLEIIPGDYQKTAANVKETISDIKNENPNAFLLFIGGEHLITLPIIEKLKPKTVIHLDSHADLRKNYLGNEYMHQTWAYHASKLAKVIQIGVENWNKEEVAVREENNVQSYNAEEFLNKDLELEGPVHLSIDIDVLENVKTGLPEGKMSIVTLMKILNKIKCDSMDICEIADDTLPSNTGFKASHIIMKVLSKKF